MVGYGAVEVSAAPQRRSSQGLVLVAVAMCVLALVAATASLTQSKTTALEQFEIVPLGSSVGGRPLMGLFLGDDAAKSLPAERVFETDGMAPQPRCPGAWCTKDPFRVYPDGRQEFGAPKDFTLTWGACNIAIQDC